jgi:hypothetical protein
MSNKLIGIAASAVVIAIAGVGLYLSGPPAEERSRRLDERRVEDLRRLAYAIDDYHDANGALPRNLEQVLERQRLRALPTDPATREPYEYTGETNGDYRLCATFDAPSSDTPGDGFWTHGAGRECFRITPQRSPR